MMPRTVSNGNVRMQERGRVKVEVWLTVEQKQMFVKLAKTLGLPAATLARRLMNYAARGGMTDAHRSLLRGYD